MRPSIPPTTPCTRRLAFLLRSYRTRYYHSTPSLSRPLRHVAFYPRKKVSTRHGQAFPFPSLPFPFFIRPVPVHPVSNPHPRQVNPVDKSLAEEAGYSYSQVHLGQLQYEEAQLNEAQVLHRKVLGARMFILNRPEKLNALTLGMIRNLGPQLKVWNDPFLSTPHHIHLLLLYHYYCCHYFSLPNMSRFPAFFFFFFRLRISHSLI